jgi:hypothetical protein
MDPEASSQTRRILGWIIHRNPSYLISACLMAVGTRLFLVGPSDPTGDVTLILLTLVVLQVYVWAVGGILLSLQRAARSPEDRPSLLLVAGVFWTGPMAATIEMTALRTQWGIGLAAGASLIAMGELRLCSKALNLRFSATGQLIGSGCVILLAAAAPLLKIPESDSGLNEIFLYATWWVLAALVLCCLGALRSHQLRTALVPVPASQSACMAEGLFLAITVAATSVHLIAMNYGFFCHAALFYASPLIVAVSFVGMGVLLRTFKWYKSVLTLFALLPLVAILLALQPFDAKVPLDRLPTWLRDPLVCVAVIAASAWWFGYHWHRRNIFLHASCAALALAALRVTRGIGVGHYDIRPNLVLMSLYGITVYLVMKALLLRSRREALAALLVNLAATAILVKNRTPADGLIVCLAVGWTGLIAVHVAARNPGFWWRAVPVAFLAVAPWTLDAASLFHRQLMIHAAAMVLVLLVVGQIWRWTHYRSVAALLTAGYLAYGARDLLLKSAHPWATTLVFTGFALLAAGAFISWHKRQLLSALEMDNSGVQANVAAQ